MGLRRQWADLVARVHRAHQEAEQAQERLDATRRDVVEPLNGARDRNQFADLIRDSLLPRRERRRR